MRRRTALFTGLLQSLHRGVVVSMAIVLCTAICSFGQPDVPSRVLFVGNSYTFFGNLPQQVALLAKSQEIDLETRQSTGGGLNLGHHWRGSDEVRTRKLIARGKFDAVVLQDQSMRAIEVPDSLQYFGALFAKEIRANGATPYLYLTWSRKWDPPAQKTITDQFTKLAEDVGAVVVPVGPAWHKALAMHPDLPLYADDGSHPSPLGTYLTACVFYGVFTGKSPVGLPNYLKTTDKDGEKLYLTIQSNENAKLCQEAAQATILEFGQ